MARTLAFLALLVFLLGCIGHSGDQNKWPAPLASSTTIQKFSPLATSSTIRPSESSSTLGGPGFSVASSTIPVNEKLKLDAYEKVGVSCDEDGDCSLPMKYAVLSHCPYGMACLDGSCAVVCPMMTHAVDPNKSKSFPLSCASDGDCDCSEWQTVGTIECVCHLKGCVAVVAKKPGDTDF